MPATDKPTRMLTFSSGGWVILVALCLSTIFFSCYVLMAFQHHRKEIIGDGKNIDSYGFNLMNLTIPREMLVASGLPRDGLKIISKPTYLSPETANNREEGRRKYLVGQDRVIGIYLNGQARAYPIHVLNWHEIINDDLGGMPILVTYSPLCDSVCIYSRKVGDSTRTFGVSGLLVNSNLVLYDHQSQSLWSQISGQSIAGPCVGSSLNRLASSLVLWEDWIALHPTTSILAPDPQLLREYKRSPYGNYFGSDLLRFPVEPLPSFSDIPLKDRVIAVGHKSEWKPIHINKLKSMLEDQHTIELDLGKETIQISRRGDSFFISPDSNEKGIETIHCFWFAWYAFNPTIPLVDLHRDLQLLNGNH